MASVGPELTGPLRGLLTETVASVLAREKSRLGEILSERNNRCVVFGAGTLGRKALELFREINIEPLALCDSNPARWNSTISGLEVLSPAAGAERFGADSVFFVTIWNDFHWFRDTLFKLNSLGCRFVSSYAPIFWCFGDRFMDLRLLNEPPHHLYQQLEGVLQAERLWADEESLRTYRANIIWRALGDPSLLPFPAPQNTYFPTDIFRLVPEESIVDCGAFDGDTIRCFLDIVGTKFAAIHAIEADLVSIEKLGAYIASLSSEINHKIHRHECAVGADRGVLRFTMSGSATSKADGDGVEVQCYTVDELFEEHPVTLIKMDIEGAEYDTVLGAEKVIRRDCPVMAICVYHTQSDIWRIPLQLRAILPSYQFFLRSYDGDGFQTVLYAIPPHRMLSDAQKLGAPKPLKSA